MERSEEKSEDLSDRESDYSSLLSLWGSYAGTQTTLYAAYLTAHSFLLVVAALFYIEFSKEWHIGQSAPVFLALLTASVSVLGLYLSFQMRLAWDRTRALISLIEFQIREIERTSSNGRLRFFEQWRAARDNPNLIIESLDKKDTWRPNWALRVSRYAWGGRWATLPWCLGFLYLSIIGFVIARIYLS